ncbi:MAG: 2-C-methyl-D-erythritol 2,4-cyclodiphosphate synthase [Candidatus Omnitrophota bacterium]
MRIGYGYDIHRLVKGRKLILGGVELVCDWGLLGYSDADVLLHAVSDALLGAAGLGDIGEHFPDTDPQYKDSDSKILLKKCRELVKAQGYKIINIDCTIFCEIIKILPYKIKMKKQISSILSLNEKNINIKAKTKEGLDAVGQKKAIAAACVVLLTST